MPEFAPKPEVDRALDWVFFLLGGVAAVWLAYLLLRQSFDLGWWQIAFLVVYWVLLAYLVLPRLHRILTRIYVPDYFIGRARTSDGLLGDPINLALLGSEPQVHEAMIRAGWTLADDLSFATGLTIVKSTVLRRSYDEAPVSPLLLFGRKQDFAYQQEVDGTPGKRHHVRFWRCPPGWKLPGGQPADWLAAGTYDKSVGFSLFTLQITHKIDERTDDERDHIVATVTDATPVVTTKVIEDFSTGYHSRNGGGDSIVTDGDLPVLDLRAIATEPGALGEEPTDSRQKRPAPIVVGALLMVLGAASTVIMAVAISAAWPEIIGSYDPSGLYSGALLAGVLWFLAILALAELFLAWLVYLGSNWARVVALTANAIALGLEVLSVATGGPAITLDTSLIPVAVDILLLLALSSQRATTYARSSRKTRKRNSSRPGGVAAY
ncbi:LssY C-terminal domain-containing protein [Antiquaquibacter oligotrophicus]|nr:LssY C-terminal domain-containing protein [Antiquaquibacter oligotrophicus]